MRHLVQQRVLPLDYSLDANVKYQKKNYDFEYEYKGFALNSDYLIGWTRSNFYKIDLYSEDQEFKQMEMPEIQRKDN